ncbi:winged helix-turn-helix transcriptional regulator [Bradyrhizobium sp. STM 3562]|uniref:winged helix-turn-helix transcriptional regulator n=1 Tax=Bradyrhizobium sp. STM 3562 TaxID=578924 RepID=UPI00388DA8B0
MSRKSLSRQSTFRSGQARDCGTRAASQKAQATIDLQVRKFLLVPYSMKAQAQCPVTFTSRVLGGKWKARIVWALLRNENLRFSEVRRACPPISDRILSKELKELEGWGLISRREYSTIPPHTEYSLTDLGQTLRPLMMAMAEWGAKTQETVVAASK